MLLATTFTVSLARVMKELSLKPIYMPEDPESVLISSMDVNRPGLELNRFYDYYDTSRILIFGNAETAFLRSRDPEDRFENFGSDFFQASAGCHYRQGDPAL